MWPTHQGKQLRLSSSLSSLCANSGINSYSPSSALNDLNLFHNCKGRNWIFSLCITVKVLKDVPIQLKHSIWHIQLFFAIFSLQAGNQFTQLLRYLVLVCEMCQVTYISYHFRGKETSQTLNSSFLCNLHLLSLGRSTQHRTGWLMACCYYVCPGGNCRDDAFADIHNLDHCIKYLNQSLVTFGFPSALNLYSSEPVRSVLYSQFFFQLPSWWFPCRVVKFLAAVSWFGFYDMITILPCFLKGIAPYIFFHVQSSIVRTCNCIYAMIQQRQRDIEYRETANDTRQR